MGTQSGIYARQPRATILFVEQDDDLRLTYIDIAESLGLCALATSDAEAGLLLAQHQSPDVIACEIPMRSVGTGPLARLWRFADEAAWLLAITADRKIDLPTFHRAGFDSVLQKPFGLAECERELARAVHGAHARRAVLYAC